MPVQTLNLDEFAVGDIEILQNLMHVDALDAGHVDLDMRPIATQDRPKAHRPDEIQRRDQGCEDADADPAGKHKLNLMLETERPSSRIQKTGCGGGVFV